MATKYLGGSEKCGYFDAFHALLMTSDDGGDDDEDNNDNDHEDDYDYDDDNDDDDIRCETSYRHHSLQGGAAISFKWWNRSCIRILTMT